MVVTSKPIQTTMVVDLGQMEVTNNRTVVLQIPNLGSGVAVVLFDPSRRVGGIAHVALPDSAMGATPGQPPSPKFADQAVPMLFESFQEKIGANVDPAQLSIRLVGGAQMFNFGGGAGNLLNVGSRNVAAIRTALARQGLSPHQSDVGGNKVRQIRLVVATGQLWVQVIGDRTSQLPLH